MNNIKLTLCFLLFTIAGMSQQGGIKVITTHKNKKFNKIEVVNMTADTLQFSLYEERKYKEKWFTNDIDIFGEHGKGSTLILSVYPNKSVVYKSENKELSIYLGYFEPKNELFSYKSYFVRYVLVPYKKENRHNEISNEILIK